jgi:hypothetical protein
MTNIYIIQGRPSLGANLMASAVKRHPQYDYRVRKMNDAACEIEYFQRNGEKWDSLGISAFTLDDARKAGTKNLDKFPRNMLFARAMSNGVRWYCPDVFGTAVYTPEEMGAETSEDGAIIDGSFTSDPEPPKATVNPGNGNGNDHFNPVQCLIDNKIAANEHNARALLDNYIPASAKTGADELIPWGKLYRAWRDTGKEPAEAASLATDKVKPQ